MSENVKIQDDQPIINQDHLKFCKHCGEKILKTAVLCIKCGNQVEELQSNSPQPSIVINNENTNQNTNNNNINIDPRALKKQKNKWIALLLCFFTGVLGFHKFYEGKILLGIIYLFSAGLFGIGVFIDFIVLLFKPNPYYL